MKYLKDWDTPPRIDEPELIDDENQPYSDFRASMRDVQNANRFLGGSYVVKKQVSLWLGEAKKSSRDTDAAITFLDVATGSADLPKVILKAANRARMQVRVVGLDFSSPILRFAREEVGSERNIRLVRGDAFNLPFADSSVDYVLCSLAFHHWGFDQSVIALREMERVAKKGWLVNDLRRSKSAWQLFKIVSNLAGMNRMTKHDGPASILRAYSLPEFHAMPQALGLECGTDYLLRQSPFYRVALIRRKQS